MRLGLVIILLLGTLIPVRAQVDSLYEISPGADYDKFNFHILGQVAIPSEELKKAINNELGNLGYGFSTGFAVNPFMKKRPSPVFLGAEFGYLFYGVDTIEAKNDIPPLKTSYNVYSFNALGRVILTQSQRFVPFIDGLVGVKVFNTRTKIDKNLIDTALNDDQEELIHKTNDAGLNYSVGLGFYTRRAKKTPDEARPSFSLRFLYVWGDETEYVIRDSIEVSPDMFVTYETGRANTTMFQIQFGLMLY